MVDRITTFDSDARIAIAAVIINDRRGMTGDLHFMGNLLIGQKKLLGQKPNDDLLETFLSHRQL